MAECIAHAGGSLRDMPSESQKLQQLIDDAVDVTDPHIVEDVRADPGVVDGLLDDGPRGHGLQVILVHLLEVGRDIDTNRRQADSRLRRVC